MAAPAFSLNSRTNAATLHEFIEQPLARQERWKQSIFVGLT